MKVLILAAALSTGAGAAAEDRVDAYIQEEMRAAHIPGLSLAVVHHGRTLKRAVYGLADVELAVPVTHDTRFAIASMTKSFTAAAVLLLEQEGRLRLDDPISRYLGPLPENWKAITIQHLLTHTSGIKDHFFDFPFYPPAPAISSMNRRLEFTEEEVLKALTAAPLNFEPGQSYAYCGSGYVLLGHIIGKVSGRPYGQVLQERIFRPLRMTGTRLIDLGEIIPERASGYGWGDGQLRNGGYTGQTFSSAADVAMLTTASDLAKWFEALASDPAWKRILARMEMPGKLADGGEAVAPFGGSYGLGWHLSTYQGEPAEGHGGSFMTGFTSSMLHLPRRELSVIVLTNQHAANPTRIAYTVAGLYEADLQPPHLRTPQADAAPELTRRVERLLYGLFRGEGDYSRDVVPVLAKRLAKYPHPPPDKAPPIAVSFIGSEEFAGGGLERNGRRIARMRHYSVVLGDDPAYLTFYFDQDGLIADYGGY
jgi:CubicO group peptidase (beta-lactamase class C family)